MYARKTTDEEAEHGLAHTGIKLLDDRLKGLPKNSVILLIGDPGSGFTQFLHQVLSHRSSVGADVLYVSLDRPQAEVLYDLRIYGWEEEGKKWKFKDLSPSSRRDSSELMWGTDPISWGHELIRRINQEKAKGGAQLDSAVNSISSMLLAPNTDISAVLGFINELSSTIRDTNGLHFLTLVHGVHGHDVEATLSHYADVVLEFLVRQDSKEYRVTFGVKKMRGVGIPPRTLFPIEFTEEGIQPVTTEKIT